MASDRIDGWKAIGLHFGRDRSTVIRWATQRGMPVHSIPGGKTRTVFALRSEIDAWAAHTGIASPLGAVPVPPSGPGSSRKRIGLPQWLALGMTVPALLLGSLAVSRHGNSVRETMPKNELAAALFVRGRDDWAKRTRTSLAQSVQELDRVTKLDPQFALAFADLADAYLLEQEAGSMPPEQAFDRAQRAASRARQLDPTLPAADRALGFIAYWRYGDRAAAGEMFRHALDRDDSDAQTHFWFANVLIDNGQDTAGMAEFDRARLLAPGSDDIAADLAWANWSAGRDKQAVDQLDAIIVARPENVEAHDCLSIIKLAAGDYVGYLAEISLRARLRGEPELLADVQTFKEAMAKGGIRQLQAAIMARAIRMQSRSAFPDYSEPAFIASVAGDRARLLAMLAAADRDQARWGAAGYIRRIAQRWPNDSAVLTLLARRRAPSIDKL